MPESSILDARCVDIEATTIGPFDHAPIGRAELDCSLKKNSSAGNCTGTNFGAEPRCERDLFIL